MLRVVWRRRESLRDLRRGGRPEGRTQGLRHSKGTIRFQADKAMPAALVRKLIKARIGEDAVKATKHGNIRLCLCSLHVQILGHEFDPALVAT